MRAITLHQPWASLIAAGVKRYETRSWAPPPYLRGQRIAIHAGQYLQPCDIGETVKGEMRRLFGDGWELAVPRGAVVATAVLYSWGQTEIIAESMSALERECGNFTPGRMAWQLTDVEALPEPVSVRGRQGFWNWEEA